MKPPLPFVSVVLSLGVACACSDMTSLNPELAPTEAEQGGSVGSSSRGGSSGAKNGGAAGKGGTSSGAGRAGGGSGGRAASSAGTSGAAVNGGRGGAADEVARTTGGKAGGSGGAVGGASQSTGGARAAEPKGGALGGAGVGGVGGSSEPLRTKPPFFSEYVEGSGSNKALELAIAESGRLDGCAIRVYANGSLTVSRTIALVGLLTPEVPLVICSPELAALGNVVCDLTATLPFNGNDVVLLSCDGVVVDAIGQLGSDPGDAGWGSGALRTQNQTLRRACSVVAGDHEPNDAFDLAGDGWLASTTDAFDGLGVRCEPVVGDGAGGSGGVGGAGGAGGADAGRVDAGGMPTDGGGGNAAGGAADL